MTRGTRSLALVLTLLAACGDDGGEPGGQAGVSGAAGSGSSGQAGDSAGGEAGAAGEPLSAPFEIAPPALPVFTPCPPGWSDKALPDGPTVCEPGPLPDWDCPEGWTARTVAADTPQAYRVCDPPEPPESCPAGQMAVVGQVGCQPIGDACPAGDWPTGLPAGKPVVHVKAGAAAGGDGSEGKPLATIAAGVAAAKAGGIVAVAKGTYAGALLLSGKKVTVWGACAAQVTLDGPPGKLPSSATVAVSGGEVTLRNLTVTGDAPGVVGVDAKLELRGVWVNQARQSGITLLDSKATLDGVRVSDTRSGADKTLGYGLWLATGVTLTGQRVHLDRNRDMGLSAEASSATLGDLLVDDTHPSDQDGLSGYGVLVTTKATVNLGRAVVRRAHSAGVFVTNQGSKAVLTDVSVRDTQPDGKGTFGSGIVAEARGQVEAQGVVASRNRTAAISAHGTGSRLTLTRSLLEQTTLEESTQQWGTGLSCYAGAQCTVEGTAIVASTSAGVVGSGAGTAVTVRDARVLDTQPNKERFGFGLLVQDGASGSVERTLLARNHLSSLAGLDPGTKLSVADVVIEDNRFDPAVFGGSAFVCRDLGCQARRLRVDGSSNYGVTLYNTPEGTSLTDVVITRTGGDEGADQGFGLTLLGTTHLAVERVWVADSQYGGVVAFNESQAHLSDVTVLDTRAERVSREGGIGLTATDASRLELDRARVEGSGYAGVSVSSEMTARDLLVRSTHAQESDGLGGLGLVVQSGGRLSLERVHARGNRVAAVLAQGASTLAMNQAWLTESQTGSFQQLSGDTVTLLEGLSDGLVLVGDSRADISATVIQGCQRAGVLFASSQGSLTGVSVEGADFGLVLRDSSEPSYDESCSFEGDQAAILPDGDLPVPDAPLKVPVPPPPPPSPSPQ